MTLSERARRTVNVLRLAALSLAAAIPSASAPAAPAAGAPWWEKVTYTISGDGAQQSCRYETNIGPGAIDACDGGPSESILAAATGVSGAYTNITIERRFTPVGQPHPPALHPGDTLLGGLVMMLDIDGAGAVRDCQMLAASGDLRPSYGCEEARAERFEASAARAAPDVQSGFLTITVYGHQGHLA
jgi:hypothetical protein